MREYTLRVWSLSGPPSTVIVKAKDVMAATNKVFDQLPNTPVVEITKVVRCG